MNLSFSPTFNSSFPHIRGNGIGFGTLANSFGHPMPSCFHNRMVKPFLGFHKTSIGNILYFIINHLTLSTKKPKQMHFCMTDNDIWAIIQIFIDPRFEIRDFLNELGNEWTILGKTSMLSSNLP
jgi:hypothetical protein